MKGYAAYCKQQIEQFPFGTTGSTPEERIAEFQLAQQPATQPKRTTFESTTTRQRVLITGLECLPNQSDLFTDLDGSN